MSKMSELHAERKIEPVEAPTLRDQFAMAALTALIAATNNKMSDGQYAWCAYRYADEMLKAREDKR